jgi:hypothetical protein
MGINIQLFSGSDYKIEIVHGFWLKIMVVYFFKTLKIPIIKIVLSTLKKPPQGTNLKG